MKFKIGQIVRIIGNAKLSIWINEKTTCRSRYLYIKTLFQIVDISPYVVQIETLCGKFTRMDTTDSLVHVSPLELLALETGND